MNCKRNLILLGVMLIVGAILAACGGGAAPASPEAPTAPPVPVVSEAAVPYMDEWKGSAHNALDTEPFKHWSNEESKFEVPTTCAKCHTSAGYQDYLGLDGSEANKVDAAVAVKDGNPGIQCNACHNAGTIGKTTVMFPSGVEISAGDDVRCMECHLGRESKVSVDEQIAKFSATDKPDDVVAPIKDDKGADVNFGFRNVHYFAAAATLYGSQTHGGYEYDGMGYDSKNTHVDGYATCTGCHNPHTLKVKVEQCATCHENVATAEDLKNVRMISSAPDYDGDGNVTEGMFYEIQGLQEVLLAEIQKYAKEKGGAEIKYDAATYPYFMDADGKAYPKWTPRLLKAAYNYQVSIKDTGAFAHGNKYIVQLLFDSINDLGGDVSKLARTDAGHFAGNTEPFRHWDVAPDNGTVPFGCVKCHTATGLPAYIKNGGTAVVTGNGTTAITGLASMPASNGFLCVTCHDDANFPNRYEVKSVTFPSGKTVSFGGQDADGNFIADDSNLCIQCHQGRESTTSMNNALKGKDLDTADPSVRFKNIHYFAAGATLFGGEVEGAYQYDGKEYAGQGKHTLVKCQDCHDVHALEPKYDSCKGCHKTGETADIRMSKTDYDGDGDVKEGIKGEVDTLAAALFAEIEKYAKDKAGAEIKYDALAYPYFMGADGKGYATWTPRLVKAAFNYQYSQKDPGAYAHNPEYIIQILMDSIEDLGGDVSKYARPEVPAPPAP